MIEVFKITHGLYGKSVSSVFLIKSETKTRGHSYSIYKRRCSLDLRKYSFSHRIVDQWNNLPMHVVNTDTIISFERAIDKLWRGTDVMYCPDTNVYESTSSPTYLRSCAHTQNNGIDYDLMLEAQ